MKSEIERVGDWYAEAEALLSRARRAAWWRNSLSNRRWVATFAELTREQEIELFREANAKADADENALSAEISHIERVALSLGQDFPNEWLDMFYLELRQIEVPNLPSARCGLIPLQELCWKVARWGRELLSLNRAQNAREVSDAIDIERWLPSACDAIGERLLLERLRIEKELKASPERSPKTGKAKGEEKQGSGKRTRRKPGSKELTDAQELIAAALREWHGFEAESLSCTKIEAITYRNLGELCKGLSNDTISTFFTEWLPGGNSEYKRLCKRGDAKPLAIELAKLSREGLWQVSSRAIEALADKRSRRPGDDIDD